MKVKPQSPIWPYLGILACLFVLSITAPRAWDRMAQTGTTSGNLAERAQRETAAREWPAAIRSEQDYVEPSGGPEPVVGVPPPSLSAVQSTLPTVQADSPAPLDSRPTQPEPRLSVSPQENRPSAPPPSITSFNPAYEQQTVVPPVFEPSRKAPPESNVVEPIPPQTIDPVDPPNDPDFREPDDIPAIVSSAWPLPRALLQHLDDVAQADRQATWTTEAIELIHELCRNVDQEGRTPMEIIGDLRTVASRRSPTANSSSHEARVIRARYALVRWLDIWEPAASLNETTAANATLSYSPGDVQRCVAEVESVLHEDSAGTAWRGFLRLDSLAKLAKDRQATVEDRRTLARSVLDRLASAQLTRAQRQFIASGPIAMLDTALHGWAAAPVGSTRLLAHLDRYEQTGLPSDARLVTNDWRGLSWQLTEQAKEIGARIETHYRNANVRVALASELLNRWIPQPETVRARVRDTIMNVPVRGRNTTFTKLFVRLVPDPNSIRIGLEANGVISTDTVSSSGPARLYNQGQSTFLVRKLLVLGTDGLAVWPAVAEADTNFNNLVSVKTGFDGVPLVGPLVRGYARSQHDDMQAEARLQVERKVAVRARDQFDAEFRTRLIEATQNAEKQQMATLRRLGLELVPVGLSTTKDRVVARVRVAAAKQLGAHTPRPRAPSDSWASLQIHQSALNNGLESLDLAGRTFTLEELFAWIAKKLDRPELANQDDLPDDVSMTFAQQDPVRLTCEEGRVEVAFSFAELKQNSRRWRDFTVRSYYHPQHQGLNPRFVRDRGTIYLQGKGLKRTIVLRMIFSRVLSVNRDLNLLDESITTDPRVADLDISQFIVEHGWIGLAYSPQRPPRNVARRPK